MGFGRERTKNPWFDNGRGSAAMCMEPEAGESTSSRRARGCACSTGVGHRHAAEDGVRTTCLCISAVHRRGLRCSGLGEIHEKVREGNGGVETFRVAFLLIGGCCCLAAWRPRGKSTSGVTVTEGGAWQRRSATHEMSMTEQLASSGILQLGVAPARRRECWDSETGTGG